MLWAPASFKVWTKFFRASGGAMAAQSLAQSVCFVRIQVLYHLCCTIALPRRCICTTSHCVLTCTNCRNWKRISVANSNAEPRPPSMAEFCIILPLYLQSRLSRSIILTRRKKHKSYSAGTSRHHLHQRLCPLKEHMDSPFLSCHSADPDTGVHFKKLYLKTLPQEQLCLRHAGTSQEFDSNSCKAMKSTIRHQS